MGVFAQRDFKQGQPILFYVGELLSANEGRKREQKYTKKRWQLSLLLRS